MPRRQTILMSPLVAFAATTCALALAQERGAAPAQQGRPAQGAGGRPAQPAQQFPPAAMDELLRQWEIQSAKLETLEVDIYRIDRDRDWGDESHYAGHAAFKNPDLAYVDYRRVKVAVEQDPAKKNKKVFVPQKLKQGGYDSKPFQTILCTGPEVWDYRSDARRLVIWTLDRDQRKKVMNEGPLPFLFRMNAGDAKARYQMALRAQDEKNSLVMVLPRLREDADVFSTAWVWLDRDFLLPRRILLISPDKAKQQEFTLSGHHANDPKGINPKFFVGVKPTKASGWTVEVNPLNADAGPADRGRGRRAAAKAAQRNPPGANANQR